MRGGCRSKRGETSGAITVLCKELAYEYKEGPLFDIIAGNSIGAMNAAVLVSNVVNRKKTWEEAAKEVGEKRAVGELRALQVFFKKTDPEKSRRALELSKKVAGSFKGKEEVEYPEGLRKKQ